MRVLVSGSHGLIGSALVHLLATEGHEVVRIVRTRPQSAGEIHWDPDSQSVDADGLEGADAVVHLAGEGISGRWSSEKKERIHWSRVDGTRLLATSLAGLQSPPKVLACASATGFYGSRGDEVLTEKSHAGNGFLASVCRDWEEAAGPARETGIRTVHLRFGVVLSPKGGALAMMVPAFRSGFGGVVGNGRQWLSWIAIEDAAGAILHALRTDSLAGPVNLVAPEPVRNREFVKTLGGVLGRSTFLPMPAFAARLALGEMASETVLASQHVRPARLLETGYPFRWPALEGALRHLLGR